MNSTPQLFKSFITKDPSEIFVKIPSSTWSPSISLEIDELENSLACRVGKKVSLCLLELWAPQIRWKIKPITQPIIVPLDLDRTKNYKKMFSYVVFIDESG